jgi:hypothetical protein
MKSDYLVWADSVTLRYTVKLDTLVGFGPVFKLQNGIPRNGDAPVNAYYTMKANLPQNTVFTDSLRNMDVLIVGSAKLRQFFEARKSKCVEYLPVGIMDHKGKLSPREYSIIHPVVPVDCLDEAKSGARYSRIAKQDIANVKKLVLDPSKLDLERELFRLDRFFRVILIRRDVAVEIDKAGLTGMRWVEPSDFPED